jgi:hypothetical protein
VGLTWYSWCGISLVWHVITRCTHFASNMHISDSIGYADVLSPRRMQTPRGGIVVGTTTTRRQGRRTMMEYRFWHPITLQHSRM